MLMSFSPAAARMVAAQRAFLETSHRLGLAALDGTAKLYRLQFQAAQQLIVAGKQGITAAGAETGSVEPSASAQTGAAQGTAPVAMANRAASAPGASLLKDMLEIVTATGGEVARIMAEQGSALRSTLVPAAAEAATATAPSNRTDAAPMSQALSRVVTDAAGSAALPPDGATSEQAVASTIAPTGATMPVAPLPASGTASAVAGAFGAAAPDADHP